MTPFRLAPPRRASAQPRETVLPMINVVFLLLIFFLMTASIEPAAPFEIDPPRAGGTDSAPQAPRVLWVSATGALASLDAQGDAALAALAAEPGPVLLRADATLPAADLAALLARLGAAGLTEVTLGAMHDPAGMMRDDP